jgi:hypothetical protein
MTAMRFLVCLGIAVLGLSMRPRASSLELAAAEPKAAKGVDLPKGDPFLQAIQSRFGKPDRVTRSDRAFLHYDLSNGDTLVLVVGGKKVVDAEHRKKYEHNGDLSDAIQSRLGKPESVTGSGRAFLHYKLSNGDTITFVVSAGRVLGAGHKVKK